LTDGLPLPEGSDLFHLSAVATVERHFAFENGENAARFLAELDDDRAASKPLRRAEIPKTVARFAIEIAEEMTLREDERTGHVLFALRCRRYIPSRFRHQGRELLSRDISDREMLVEIAVCFLVAGSFKEFQ